MEDKKVLPFENQERLDEQDAAEFLPVLTQLQSMHQTLTKMQTDLNAHSTNTVKQQGVFEYLFKRIRQKYGLGDGDNVTTEGLIIRKE